jgi:hypothetical protein
MPSSPQGGRATALSEKDVESVLAALAGPVSFSHPR